MIGTVGICSKGIKGYITGRERLAWGLSWVGYRQDNGSPWASRNPTLIEERPSLAAMRAAGKFPEWEVTQSGDSWSLNWDYGIENICPAEWPVGLAIDAATEFMDRYRERNMPRWVQSPSDLMRFCAGEAKRQR